MCEASSGEGKQRRKETEEGNFSGLCLPQAPEKQTNQESR